MRNSYATINFQIVADPTIEGRNAPLFGCQHACALAGPACTRDAVAFPIYCAVVTILRLELGSLAYMSLQADNLINLDKVIKFGLPASFADIQNRSIHFRSDMPVMFNPQS